MGRFARAWRVSHAGRADWDGAWRGWSVGCGWWARSTTSAPRTAVWRGDTPPMAAGAPLGRSDHVWRMDDLLHYRVPPARWRAPTKWGRRTKVEEALIARWSAV